MITARTASPASHFTQVRFSITRVKTQSATVSRPTPLAISRWVCSKKTPPNPMRNREQEHIVTEAVRPIRDRHSSSVTGDQSAAADQDQNAGRHENRVPVQEPFR